MHLDFLTVKDEEVLKQNLRNGEIKHVLLPTKQVSNFYTPFLVKATRVPLQNHESELSSSASVDSALLLKKAPIIVVLKCWTG